MADCELFFPQTFSAQGNSHLYFVHINNNHTADTDIKDSFGHAISSRQEYVENIYDGKNGIMYGYGLDNKKDVYFFIFSSHIPLLMWRKREVPRTRRSSFYQTRTTVTYCASSRRPNLHCCKTG